MQFGNVQPNVLDTGLAEVPSFAAPAGCKLKNRPGATLERLAKRVRYGSG